MWGGGQTSTKRKTSSVNDEADSQASSSKRRRQKSPSQSPKSIRQKRTEERQKKTEVSRPPRQQLTEEQIKKYTKRSNQFIGAEIGSAVSSYIPLRFMARTQHVAWQWREGGVMQYQVLIGGGSNSNPEDSLGEEMVTECPSFFRDSEEEDEDASRDVSNILNSEDTSNAF